MPSDATVSVLVPVSGQHRYLPSCLESIRAQTYGDLEIVLLDDGSTGGTGEIARAASQEDGRVRVETSDAPLGRIEGYRACLERAGGEFVKFVLPQDRLAPTAIEKLVAKICSEDDAILATSARELIGAHGEALPPTKATVRWTQEDAVVVGRAIGELCLKNAVNLVGELSALLFRASALQPRLAFSIAGADFHRLSDLALVLRLMVSGRLAYVSEPLCFIRDPADADAATPLNSLLAEMEWLQLIEKSQRIGYLDLMENEASGVGNVLSRTTQLALTGSNILMDEMSGAFREVSAAIAKVCDKALKATRVSMILPPSRALEDALVDCLAAGIGSGLEIVSVEEAGLPPVFRLPTVMVPVNVAEVPPGISDIDAWNAGAGIANGRFLLFLADSVVSSTPDNEGLGTAARRAADLLDAHPLVGAVGLCPPDESARACVVRTSAFSALGGLPVGGSDGASAGALDRMLESIRRSGFQIEQLSSGRLAVDQDEPAPALA